MRYNEKEPLDPLLQQWEQLKRERQRIREENDANQQKAKLREQEYQARRERMTLERQEIGRRTVRELEEEVRRRPFFAQLAGNIKNNMWETLPFAPIHLTEVSEPDVRLQDNGTVINRSTFGVRLSYSHMDAVISRLASRGFNAPQAYYKRGITEQTLTFGIGYFGNEKPGTRRYGQGGEIVREAEKLVTAEELEKGVKAYFVAGRYDRTFIPFALAKREKVFLAVLLHKAEELE